MDIHPVSAIQTRRALPELQPDSRLDTLLSRKKLLLFSRVFYMLKVKTASYLKDDEMKNSLAPFAAMPVRNFFIERARAAVLQGHPLNLTERLLGIMALNRLLATRRLGYKTQGVIISDAQVAYLTEQLLDISPARAARAPIPGMREKGGIFNAKS